MHPVIQHLAAFFQENTLSSTEKGILVAVSGGPDSIALAHGLHRQGLAGGIAHVNYHLRPESDQEEELVRRFAEGLGLAFHLKSLPREASKVAGASTQARARELRYSFFEETMKAEGYAWCATAHHRGDQAETIVLSLLRGGHPGEIATIPALRGAFLRPFLDLDRGQITDYLQAEGLAYATDSSNLKPDYLRNKIRLDVLPALREINPGAEARLVEIARANEEQREALEYFLEKEMAPAVHKEDGEIRFEMEKVLLPGRIKKLAVMQLLKSEGFFGNEIAEVLRLLDGLVGAGLEFRGRKIVHTKEGLLIRSVDAQRYQSSQFLKIVFPDPLPSFHEARTADRRIVFRRLDGVPAKYPPPKGRHWIDVDRLAPPLVLRRWEEGDRMQPLGMRGSKLLSDIFSEMGLNVLDRELAWVLADAKGPILVEGYRIADRLKISGETRTAGELEIEIIVNEAPNPDVHGDV